MNTIILIALAAGAASALMFASIISGALISLLLFYLSPLPLIVASIAWGPLSSAIGGVAAAIGLGAIFGIPYCIAFLVMAALPAWWLGHLVLLGRPMTEAASGDSPAAPLPLEWYPIGRILLWIAGFTTLATMASLLTLGTDAATITSTMQHNLLRDFGSIDTDSSIEDEQWINALVNVAPAAAAIVTVLTLTISLWLGAKVTATLGRLRRPWPDLRATTLPAMTLVALSVAVAFCFSGGLLAMAAQAVATALTMAYAMIGFAVLHTVTLELKSRTVWLSFAYTIVFVFSWTLVLMAALGLADAVCGLRQRYLRSRPPPPLPAS
ncbi:MAG TPA: DUF2232 domain-containing protein [Bradyrhizobium sp.]|nr:DUF2232 domain-containing protein [Bradyrhizobium sp.]